MAEYIINGLFIIVILMALGLLVYSRNPQSNMTNKQRKMLLRILVATIFLLVIELLPSSLFEGRLGYLFNLTLYLIDYLIIGYDILLKALKGIKNKQVLDECFLMTLATLGAIALALYERSSDYTEAIAVMLFYQIGEWFQSYAVGKSRRNISDLMDIRPDFANVEIEGKRYSHIIDIETGLGLTRRSGATVIHSQAAYSDALATLACILEPEEAIQFLKKHDAKLRLIYIDSDNKKQILTTSNFPEALSD